MIHHNDEFHNEDEITKIADVELDVIGINNRNLHTLKTDINHCLHIRDKYTDQLPDIYYEVEGGDSLQIVAEKFNTTIAQIADLNQLQGRNNIQVGQRLFLPVNSNPTIIPDNQEEQVLLAEVAKPDSQDYEPVTLPTAGISTAIENQSLANNSPNSKKSATRRALASGSLNESAVPGTKTSL